MRLTRKQHETLIWVAKTGSYKGAAEAMGVATSTVKNHMLTAMHKYEVSGTIELLGAVGWIDIPLLDTILYNMQNGWPEPQDFSRRVGRPLVNHGPSRRSGTAITGNPTNLE